MAHAVENMFSVRETPWHGLGKVITDNPTIDEGIKLAGLDWEVQTESIWTGDDKKLDSFGKCVRRMDNGKILGVVGPTFTPVQNYQSFDWFAPFIDSGECKLTTAGSLHNGKIVWIMAEIQRGVMDIGNGDTVRKFLLLSNSHDGSRAVRVGFTPVRVVCANTLGMAHRDENSKLLRIKHTRGVIDTLAKVRETVDTVDAAFNATAKQFRILAGCKINKHDLRNYVTVLMASDVNNPTSQEQTKIDECISRALTGKGNSPDMLTAWSAYNGITEYLSYATAHRSKDNRLDSLWFGENKKLLDEAFTQAMALAM